MNGYVRKIIVMVSLPLLLAAQESDTTLGKTDKDFMYDLGIKIEPARESAPLQGIGVANPSLVRLQSQMDSLTSAFSEYKQVTDRQIANLTQALDSLKLINRRVANRVFLSPYAALGAPRLIYSKKEGERFFQKGKDAYNARNYPVAVDYFVKCVDSDVSGSLIGDAYFWIGNCYIHLKDDYLALEYLKRVPEYPLCENVDDALFLTAVTYRKLGDTALATVFLERLLRRFPDGDMAKLAALELKRLKSMD